MIVLWHIRLAWQMEMVVLSIFKSDFKGTLKKYMKL